MARTKNLQTIIQDFIDFIKLAQPDADTKPATVIRDILIDAPATQLSAYYDQLGLVSRQLSFKDLSGTEIESYVKNFGLFRKSSSPSSGIALLTFANIFSDIGISSGDLIYSNSGLSFTVLSGTTISSKNINLYKSVALKYKNDLDFLGITDLYAVEVSVQCTSPGVVGNVSKYSLNRTNIDNVTNVTNIFSFENGKDSETDVVLKNRFVSTLNGASTGTSLGYSSAALSVVGVSDSVVIEPGDPLMTRDGTITSTLSDGTIEIISEGTGGKVDVLILGSNLQENSDSFIYRDKSNTKDPTNPINDFILGQISSLNGKTIARKRYQSKQLGVLPFQPVQTIVEVTGSSSGANFIPKSTDEFGRVSGNYEIIKDENNFAGSPFSSDRFHWISNKISDFSEDKIKGQAFAQDKVTFTDVTEFKSIAQNIQINSENSTILSDNKYILLSHTPATNVSRVFNVNTGERYLVVNQNPDGGQSNTTGRVLISGKTLPRQTDTLQVDYNWIYEYNRYSDFDGKINTNNLRSATDSIDWGFGSQTIEKIKFKKDASNNFYIGASLNQIASITDIQYFISGFSTTYTVLSGQFINRKAVDFRYLPQQITSINSIIASDGQEIWITPNSNGSIVISIENDNSYKATVILPTDCVIDDSEYVEMLANKISALSNSTFNNNTITIPAENITTLPDYLELRVVYIAKINELVSSDVSALPVYKTGNGYNSSSNIPQNTNDNQSFIREACVTKQDVSLNYYINLTCSSDKCLLDISDIINIVDISTGNSLIDGASISINNSSYIVNINPSTSPVTGNNVVVIYKPIYKTLFQPSIFQNDFFYCNKVNFNIDAGSYLLKQISSFTPDETGINFDVINSFTREIEQSYTDGYIEFGVIKSASIPFINPSNVVNKLIKINSGNSKGIWYPTYESSGYKLGFKPTLSKQDVVIIRLADNKDVSDSILEINFGSNFIKLDKTKVTSSDKLLFCVVYNSTTRSVSTNLGVNLIDQNSNIGVIQVIGDRVVEITSIFTATSSGLTQDISELLRVNNLTGYSIIDIKYLSKVNTTSSNSQDILSVNNTYDLKNCKIKNNMYSNFVKDDNLYDYQFTLNNVSSNYFDNGSNVFVPKIGDRLKITVYLLKKNYSEILSFVRQGNLYTSSKFISVKEIKILSGFKSTVNSKLTISNLNQPGINSRYKVYYDYTSPKSNERINIRYDYNKLINDVSFAIDKIRPINADVIVKAAKQLLVNVTMNIVIDSTSTVNSNTIVQNLKDALINALNSQVLGGVIDSSDLINTAYSISGIDRVRIIGFNKNGEAGQVLSITAQKDEYFVANIVTINVESR